ncbi:unnamed protein product, partial [Prorocentrum cordatum]
EEGDDDEGGDPGLLLWRACGGARASRCRRWAAPRRPPRGPGRSRTEQLPSVEGLQDLSVSLRRHSTHGTVVVLAKVGGPLCSAGMLFATEASDDKGLCHCLEHLCFMGSRLYQKG